jgi:hypothetical protein
MKKLLYLVTAGIICLAYFSCSSENEVAIDDSSHAASAFRIADPDVGTAKSLYITMMSSTEYNDLKSSIAAFNAKLKNHDISFPEKAKWMAWINEEISTTSFTSVSEFETMYDDSVSKLAKMMAANKTLFDFLGKADNDQIGIITGPEFDPPGHTTESDCIDGCIEDFENGEAVGGIMLNSALENAFSYYNPLNPMGRFYRITSAFQSFWNFRNNLIDVFGTCVNNCG